jgi:UDP-N-acetylglucosamine acyltransferase
MAPTHRIHPSAVIGDQVSLGDDVTVGPGAVLLGPLRIGNRVWIGPQVVIGTPPEIASLRQNAAWDGDIDHQGVDIGDDVVIRELSTIHQGSHRATVIGSGSWLLNSVYVAHDSLVGRDVTLSAGVRLGGHAVIGDRTNIGMNAAVHQYRILGPGAMVGMGTPVTRDLPPFAKAFGSPVRLHGLNSYVLTKLGVSSTIVDRMATAYAQGDFTFAEFAEFAPLADFATWWMSQNPTRLIGIGSHS